MPFFNKHMLHNGETPSRSMDDANGCVADSWPAS